jgi:PAS domain S-box-containing protein
LWQRAWKGSVERYFSAVLLAAVSGTIRAAVLPVLGPRSPYLFFYPAVLLAAWFGGPGPGIAAVAASVLLAPLLLAPIGRFAEIESADWASLVGFVVVNVCLLLAANGARRARSAAEQEGSRTREILDQLGIGFVIVDGSWRYRFVNPEAERILRRPASELLGREIRQVFPLDPDLVERLRRAMENREAVEFETRHAPRDLWFLVRVFPVREGIGVFFLDITQRKRDEDAVRESREMLVDALRSARMTHWSWDIETGNVSWSENVEEVHGIPRGSFGGSLGAFFQLVVPEDRARVREAIEGAVSRGGEYEVEFRIAAPSGAIEWIEGHGHAEMRDGKPVRLVGLATNITAKKAAEGDRSLLASIVRSSDDAILSMTLDERVMTWNAAAERMYGYRAEEVLGRPISLLVPPEKIEELSTIMERIQRGERVEHHETLRRRRDGSFFEAALTVSPIFDEAGRIIGASKISRDISASKRAERERQRTRELFLGILGHDLRNPLNTIVASLYSLEKNGPDPVRRIGSRMSRAADRMARMIDHLLDFTRARLGEGIPIQPTPGDLGEICSDVVEELEAQQPGRVRLDSAGDLGGQFDADRIKQAVSNLIVNAVVHGSADAPVLVRLSAEGHEIRLEVSNRGTPIPAADREVIFEPFRRSHMSEVRDSSGLGLGLYIAREIIRSHGGSIDVESDPAETRFVVRLPAGQPTS